MAYLFTPPGAERPVGTDRLWARFTFPVSFTLLKKDGFYTLTETPADEDVAAADLAYLSGHTYQVTSNEADALTAAGYGDYLVPLPASGAYGSGTYGSGSFGSPRTSSGYGSGPYGYSVYGE